MKGNGGGGSGPVVPKPPRPGMFEFAWKLPISLLVPGAVYSPWEEKSCGSIDGIELEGDGLEGGHCCAYANGPPNDGVEG